MELEERHAETFIISLSKKEAKQFGLEFQKGEQRQIEVQFKVEAVDAGDGSGFTVDRNQNRKEAALVSVKSQEYFAEKYDNPNAPGVSPLERTNTVGKYSTDIFLNEYYFSEDLTIEERQVRMTKYLNSQGKFGEDAKESDIYTVIAHENYHDVQDKGHEDGGLGDIINSKVKFTKNNAKAMIKDRKEQVKKAIRD